MVPLFTGAVWMCDRAWFSSESLYRQFVVPGDGRIKTHRWVICAWRENEQLSITFCASWICLANEENNISGILKKKNNAETRAARFVCWVSWRATCSSRQLLHFWGWGLNSIMMKEQTVTCNVRNLFWSCFLLRCTLVGGLDFSADQMHWP